MLSRLLCACLAVSVALAAPVLAQDRPAEHAPMTLSQGAEALGLMKDLPPVFVDPQPEEPFGAAVFTPGIGFLAYDFDDNATETGGSVTIPPDPMGAAGPDRLIAVLNVGIDCRDKTGALIFRDSLQDFFGPAAGVGAGTLGTLTFDPKVVYDHYEDRFVVVTLERWFTNSGDPSNESRILIAVSKTSAPATATAADWWYGSIDSKISIGGFDHWADYPGFEVDEEAVYITNNMFGFPGGGSTGGVRLWIVDKGVVGGFYAGSPAAVTVHDPIVGGAFTLTSMPALVYGAGGVAPGVGTFLVGYSSLTFGGPGGLEAVQIIRIDNPLGVPVFTPQFITVGDLEDVGGVFGFPDIPDAPQLGIAATIEVNNSRILDAVWRENGLWCTTTINPNAAQSPANVGEATAHWFHFDTSALAAITVADQGNIGGEDIAPNSSTYFPAVAVNGLGEAKFGYSASAATIYGGGYFSGREPGDPAGTVQPAGVVQAGLDYYLRTFGGTRNRWGDYTGASVDPADDRTFWIFNQYADTRGTVISGEDGRWGTAWRSCSTAEVCAEPDCPPDRTVAKGEDVSLEFCVSNCGNVPITIEYSLVDDRGWCGALSGTETLNPGTTVCYTAGCLIPDDACPPDEVTITFEIRDPVSGDATDCTTILTVVNQPPVAVCKDIEVLGPGPSPCSIAAVDPLLVDDGSSDPEGQPLTYALVPSGPYAEGMNPVTLVVTDDCGLSDSCPATITVTCPPPLFPDCEIFPEEICFEAASWRDTSCVKVTVKSTGTADLEFAGLSWDCDNSEFFWDLTEFSFTVPPGDSTCFTVCYSPSNTSIDSCTITMDSNKGIHQIPIIVKTIVSVDNEAPLPAGLTLARVSPNPFQSSARVRFALPESRFVQLDVYDFRGGKVRTVWNGERSAGEHELTWDGRDDLGGTTAAGIYFFNLVAGSERKTIRAVRLQ